jgi:hypothetical protein
VLVARALAAVEFPARFALGAARAHKGGDFARPFSAFSLVGTAPSRPCLEGSRSIQAELPAPASSRFKPSKCSILAVPTSLANVLVTVATRKGAMHALA